MKAFNHLIFAVTISMCSMSAISDSPKFEPKEPECNDFRMNESESPAEFAIRINRIIECDTLFKDATSNPKVIKSALNNSSMTIYMPTPGDLSFWSTHELPEDDEQYPRDIQKFHKEGITSIRGAGPKNEKKLRWELSFRFRNGYLKKENLGALAKCNQYSPLSVEAIFHASKSPKKSIYYTCTEQRITRNSKVSISVYLFGDDSVASLSMFSENL